MRGREWDSSFHSEWQKRCHHEPASGRRGDRILTTTEKPSLRTNEVSVAIPLFAIHKPNLQNVKIKMQNVDNLFQIDSSKPIIDYYNKYKSKTKCVGDNEIPHFIRNDKKGMSLRATKLRGNPIIDYNPKSHHEPAECRRGDRIIDYFGAVFMFF